MLTYIACQRANRVTLLWRTPTSRIPEGRKLT